jgi:putative ABC transport system ATP-binding protein
MYDANASGEAVIRLENVTKTYIMGEQEVHAMQDVSMSIEEGLFCAVMGPSGSGKSTMLNLLGCLDRPTSGRYILANEDVSTLNDDKLSDIRLKYLGFVFQSFNLIPQLTVRENIELPLFYLGWDEDASAKHATEIAEQVGLTERLAHRPTELSGGQQQRVAVARALANDPKIILADEPTGNLDTATGAQIMELLCDLSRQGKTIIMVTHEAHIAAHATRRIHMLDGRIDRIEDDGPESASPAHGLTA